MKKVRFKHISVNPQYADPEAIAKKIQQVIDEGGKVIAFIIPFLFYTMEEESDKRAGGSKHSNTNSPVRAK